MVKYEEYQINRTFHALSDPTRRKILKMVSAKSRKASELAQSFSMSFPAVSKHLKVLEQAYLIERQINGRVHTFILKEKAMKRAYNWIKFYEKFWISNLDNLNDFLTNKGEIE